MHYFITLITHLRACLLWHEFLLHLRGAGPPNEAEMLAEEADVRLHLVLPLLGCLWTCISLHPFLGTPSPQVCRKWRALYPVKWVDSTQSYDLICDVPSELQ